jgi:hypothetical protein
MTRKSFSFLLGGGLDEISQPLAIEPGRAIACVNHEVIEAGYGRILGFERYDGRTGPTDYPFYTLRFTDGDVGVSAGATLLGGTSGATGTVLVDAALESGAWDGTGTGIIGLRDIAGDYVFGEQLFVGGVPVGIAALTQSAGVAGSGDPVEEAIAEATRDYARAIIAAVPGSGDVRGVWEFGGSVYAFRDNSLATACVMYEGTATGWVAVNLGHTLDFTSGGTTEVAVGDTVTGASSGSTGVVRRVIVQSGDWTAGTAVGYLVLSGVVGTFAAENLDVGASSNVATVAGDAVNITLPAGGQYFFINYNFYGASQTRRVYGVNGVGPGFEFDGTYFVPIRTGMATDTPTRVAAFRNHLFFAFPSGSIQHSATGEPISWEPILGAAEIMIGSDVADFIVNVDSLIILGEHGVFNLTGYDISDWLLNTITLEAGGIPFTAQRFGPGIYLDNRGLRSVTATQAYGNFAMATMTTSIQKTLKRKAAANARPTASVIVRTKNHYRLFFSDGTGLSFYLGRKKPEPMYFDLGKKVCCISSNESEADVERVFFGSEDGFVYQLDKGTSFDGSNIEAFLQMPYAHMGSPQVLKRVFKVSLEVVATSGTSLGITVEYDYSRNEQVSASQSTVTADGAGALYGVGEWGSFYWGSPVENILEAEVDGQGRNASIILYSNDNSIAPYELRGATIYYGERGAIR